MAKKFQFDDEIEEVIDSNESISNDTDVNEVISETIIYNENEVDQVEESSTLIEEEESMAKKKKFVLKKWHYLIIALVTLAIAFIVYIFVKSNNDGPVYGNRLDGLLTIEESVISNSETNIKNKISKINAIDINVEGKKVKFMIDFKDGTSTDDVKSICKEALELLDQEAGFNKGDNAYSELFGMHKNVTQYEVNYYLTVSDNKDFPAFATKHVQNDEISYTFASIVDKDSHDKAKETLED